MDAIRIVNLRSLEDTRFIDLKPITILVGQNSSGKSTFLRTFPLLRQSVEERTTGPILWYGRYVDFGSFSESVNANNQSKEISFGFRYKLTSEIRRNISPYRISDKDQKGEVTVETLITIQSNRSKEEGYVSSVELRVDNQDRYLLALGASGDVKDLWIKGNKIPSTICSKISPAYTSLISLIPVIRFEGGIELREILAEKTLLDVMENESTSKTDRNRIKRLIDVISHFGYEQYDPFFDWGLNDIGNVLTSNDELKNRLTPDQTLMIQIIIQLSLFSSLLREVQFYISSFSKTCTYIAPVRASAERFYRPQNLSVEDVDFQGKNLAVFLRSLNANEMDKFNKWTEEHFNFYAKALISGGQLSILIKEGGVERNLADTGFGYSQALPVITQLWSLVTSRPKPGKRGIPILFSIEQPELHLHPRMQAKFADALVDAVKMSKKENIKLQLLIETHSETIVNRLGHRIIRGDISPDEVSVVIFNKDESDQPTNVCVGKFDHEGFLTNWPYGFFEPEFEE